MLTERRIEFREKSGERYTRVRFVSIGVRVVHSNVHVRQRKKFRKRNRYIRVIRARRQQKRIFRLRRLSRASSVLLGRRSGILRSAGLLRVNGVRREQREC